MPGRSWLRLAAVIAAAVLLLVAVVVAYNLGRGRTPLGAVPDDDDPTATPSSQTPISPAADPITGVTATDFDPEGTPPEENPELAPLAVDGDTRPPGGPSPTSRTSARAASRPASAWSSTSAPQRDVTGVDVTVLGGSTGLSALS